MDQGRRNRILLIVLVVLAAYLIVTVVISKRGLKHSNFLVDFPIGDVTSFGIMNDRVNLVFRRVQSSWSIDGLQKIRVSKVDIDSFLDDVRQIDVMKRIKETGPLQAFGLDVTNAVLTLTVAGKPIKIVRGGMTASGAGFYAGMDGKIVVLNKKYFEMFSKDLFYFRSKRLLDVSSDRIDSAEIRYRGVDLRISRDSSAPKERPWRLVFPFTRSLKTEDVNTFLFEIEELEAKEFVDGQGLNLPYYGLPSPDRIIVSEKNGTRNEIMLGHEGPKGVYAAVNGDMSILYVVDPYSGRTSLSNFVRTFTSRDTNTDMSEQIKK